MSLHEYLEELKDLRKSATIRFRDVDGAVAEIKTHIRGITSVSDREMIETEDNFSIGTDQILSINDQSFSNLC